MAPPRVPLARPVCGSARSDRSSFKPDPARRSGSSADCSPTSGSRQFVAATDEIDRRAVTSSNASVTIAYNNIQQSRGYFRDAIVAMKTYLPDNVSQLGELYFGLGFIEMQMAEDFCNGIPLGSTSNSRPVYGAPNTNAAVFNIALAHIDSGLSLANAALTVGIATDTAFARLVQRAVLVARARVLVDLGQFATAAVLPAGADLPGFTHVLDGRGLNRNWSLNTRPPVYTVSDSVDGSGVVRTRFRSFDKGSSCADGGVPTSGASTA
jgi:hypothetical protein